MYFKNQPQNIIQYECVRPKSEDSTFIKKISKIFILSLFFGGCATKQIHNLGKDIISFKISESDPPPSVYFDESLKPYIDKFVAEAKEHGVDILSLPKLRQVLLVEKLSTTDDPNVIAICKRAYHSLEKLEGFNIIKSESKWFIVEVSRPAIESFVKGKSTEEAERLKLLVISHEAAHCLLDWLHATYGIMSPSMSPNTPLAKDDLSMKRAYDEVFSPIYMSTIPKDQ